MIYKVWYVTIVHICIQHVYGFSKKTSQFKKASTNIIDPFIKLDLLSKQNSQCVAVALMV